MSANCHAVIVQLNSVEVLADAERFPGGAPALVQWKRGSEGRVGDSNEHPITEHSKECMRGWFVKFTHTQLH